MRSYTAALVLLVLLAGPAVAQQTGTDTVTLSNIYGVTETGQPYPPATPDCQRKYMELLGQKVVTKYQINTKTFIMIAESMLFGESVVLHPLGISGTFAFMSDGVPAGLKEMGITRVIFELDTNLQNPRSSLLADLEGTTNNCVINNSYR